MLIADTDESEVAIPLARIPADKRFQHLVLFALCCGPGTLLIPFNMLPEVHSCPYGPDLSVGEHQVLKITVLGFSNSDRGLGETVPIVETIMVAAPSRSNLVNLVSMKLLLRSRWPQRIGGLVSRV